MAMYFYYLSYSTVGKKTRRKRFPDKSEAFDTAKALIVKCAKDFDIDQYISAIRKGVNVKFRAIVADYLEEFFTSEKFTPHTDELPCMSEADDYLCDLYNYEDTDNEDFEPPSDPLNDFYVYDANGLTVFEFSILKNLCITIDIPFDYSTGISDQMLVSMKDSEHEITVSIKCKTIDWYLEKPSNSANILLVYKSLTKHPQTREKIRQRIRYFSNTDISLKTIGKQIDTLRKIGVPIAYTGLNRYMRQSYDTQSGFYLDDNAVPPEIDRSVLSELGTRVNPMLVLLAMENANGPMRQAEIIDTIEKTYGVKIARAAIGRHIKMLQQLDFGVKKTNDGFLVE